MHNSFLIIISCHKWSNLETQNNLDRTFISINRNTAKKKRELVSFHTHVTHKLEYYEKLLENVNIQMIVARIYFHIGDVIFSILQEVIFDYFY